MKKHTFIPGILIIVAFILFPVLLASCNDQEVNVAIGKSCTTLSSNESDGWSVDRLTDGEKGGTGWSSKAYAMHANRSLYPEFIVVDLGASYAIDEVSLFPRGDGEMAGKGFPEDFTIQVSMEGEPWKVIVDESSYPEPINTEAQAFKLKKTKGRFVKIEATRFRPVAPGEHFFQLSEIEVFGRELDRIPFEKAAYAPDVAARAVTGLRCEHDENPIGMDVPNPRLSWKITSPERGVMQEAYEILVASDESKLEAGEGDMWNSGKMEGRHSIWVKYQGEPLQSGKQYWWKVRVYDNKGMEYDWSQPASFFTGKINQGDWKGKWIGASGDTGYGSVYLRSEIDISKEVKRAMVYFCGLGYSELSIDGKKVGDYVMGPGFTSYNKRAQYLAFDVTDQLSAPGPKALGVTLAGGWYWLKADPWIHEYEKNEYVDRPKLLLDLHIEYSDGTESVITSDESWKWSPGTVTFSDIAHENIDLRRSKPGWDRTGYDDSDWAAVKQVSGPEGILVHQREPLTRVIEEIHPEYRTYDPETNTYKFSFISEFAGVVKFRTKGEKGQEITVTTIPSDLNYPNHNQFILNGGGDYEVYDPRFYNIGIRQVAITGATHVPELEDVTVMAISSLDEKAASFRCSHDFLNYMENMVGQTMKYYTSYLPNDPTREWKAWTDDILNHFWFASYQFKDAQKMYERWQYDLLGDQRADGNVPNCSPGYNFDGHYNSPWWGGMIIWLPWKLHQYFGDETMLRVSYPSMKRYLDYLTSVSDNGLQDWGLLDWLPIEETPRPMINTPAYYLYANIVSETAEMVGATEDVKKYADLAKTIRKTFNDAFLDPETGIYGVEGWEIITGEPMVGGIVPHEIWWEGDRVPTQGGQTLALELGLAPEEMIPLVEQVLLKEIEAHYGCVSTGMCTVQHMLEYLADLAPEIGWEMTTTHEYPSWYSNTVSSDNTLVKETWGGGQVFMPSQIGSIVGWLYHSLGGIRPGGPGYKEILIKPNLVGDLHWVNSSYQSIHGEIVSNWKLRGNQVVINVSIPANTSATVYIPTADAANVTESGESIDKVEGVRFIRMENDRALFAVGSGSYSFQSVIP